MVVGRGGVSVVSQDGFCVSLGPGSVLSLALYSLAFCFEVCFLAVASDLHLLLLTTL